nr:MAG TPA: hypothetical protein [Caudoviricetes sp.]
MEFRQGHYFEQFRRLRNGLADCKRTARLRGLVQEQG